MADPRFVDPTKGFHFDVAAMVLAYPFLSDCTATRPICRCGCDHAEGCPGDQEEATKEKHDEQEDSHPAALR